MTCVLLLRHSEPVESLPPIGVYPEVGADCVML